MSLSPIPLNLCDLTPPTDVLALIRDADERVAEFMRVHRGEGYSSFVPSDFSRVYTALLELRERGLATGDRFCEWGSGVGVVALLANLVGFDAVGIEIEPALVEEAEQLADDYEIAVDFACGSFVPADHEHIVDRHDDAHILDHGGADGYEPLGLDPDDFDVIYAFPWPGEHHMLEKLFDAVAATGALLVTYNGIEDVIVHRKID